MFRLEIVTGRAGLDRDHIAWSMFRLVPHGHTEDTVTYSCRLPANLDNARRQIIEGWIEEGDIIAYHCQAMQE